MVHLVHGNRFSIYENFRKLLYIQDRMKYIYECIHLSFAKTYEIVQNIKLH